MYCFSLFTFFKIFPTYSPIKPKNNIWTPEKNTIIVINVEYPRGKFGFKIFSIIVININKRLIRVIINPRIEKKWIGIVEFDWIWNSAQGCGSCQSRRMVRYEYELLKGKQGEKKNILQNTGGS
mgnify:CR=1 FL=1